MVAVRVEERGWTEKSLPQMGACNFHRNTLISNPLQRIVVVSWGDIDIPSKTEVYEASGNTPFPISIKTSLRMWQKSSPAISPMNGREMLPSC